MAGNRLTDDDDEKLAVDRIQHKSSRYVYALAGLSGIGGFLVGFDAGAVSGAMILLKEDMALSIAWQTALVSATIAAAAIFTLIGGLLNERYGRKSVLLCATFVFTLGAVLESSANSKTTLLTGRIVVGIGIGLISITSSVYIAELVPSGLRQGLVTGYALLISAGQLTASCLNGFLASSDTATGWRYMLALAAIPSAVQFVGFIFLPESPVWLISQGRHDEAKSALRRVRDESVTDVDEEFNLLKLTVEEKYRNVENSYKSILKNALHQPTLRRALIVGCGLHMVQQFVGINAVMYYGATIIQMAGLVEKPYIIWIAAAASGLSFLAAVLGMYLADKIGRRPLTIFSLVGVLISLSILAIGFHITTVNSPAAEYQEDITESAAEICRKFESCDNCLRSHECGFCYQKDLLDSPISGSCVPLASISDETHAIEGRCQNMTLAAGQGLFWTTISCPTPGYAWLPIVGLVMYLMSFTSGMALMPWIINSEMYPNWARAVGTATGSVTNWLCNLLVTFTFLFLLEAMPRYGIFWMFVSAAFLGIIFVFFLLPETKGRNLDEVESLFADSWAETVTSVLPTDKPVQYVHVRGLNRDGRGLSLDSDSD